MAFSAARFTVAWVMPLSLDSAFSIVCAQFMQVMPPMLSVILLFLASVMVDVSLLLWFVYLGGFSIINISFKDIS